jgi:hypothetical protein
MGKINGGTDFLYPPCWWHAAGLVTVANELRFVGKQRKGVHILEE